MECEVIADPRRDGGVWVATGLDVFQTASAMRTRFASAALSSNRKEPVTRQKMSKRRTEILCPIGASVADDIERRRRENPKFQAEYDRLAGFEQLARIVIMRRTELGISQEELARRMSTTASVISRIESGQHTTSAKTLKRLGEALGGQAVIGFDSGSAKRPKRELVTL
jgi:ribosome-binding protein aMBF1 (putative translation factor)